MYSDFYHVLFTITGQSKENLSLVFGEDEDIPVFDSCFCMQNLRDAEFPHEKHHPKISMFDKYQ